MKRPRRSRSDRPVHAASRGARSGLVACLVAGLTFGASATFAEEAPARSSEASRTVAVDAGPGEKASAHAPVDARRAKVALRVGERVVTVGELEDRLAGIPPYQLTMFGGSARDVIDAYVEQVLVRDLVLAEGAKTRGLGAKEPALYQLARARSSATLRALRRALGTASSIPEADVKAYYDAHIDRFDTPERVNLWRILCATEGEARTILAEAERDLSTTHFNDLAREHSLDQATKFRGGNLGFLDPQGVSNQAGLKVDPALVKAASSAKEGTLVPHPVPEGSAFAVVWRRATVPATQRALSDVSAEIRATLYRERVESAEKKLIDELRSAHVRDVDPSLLGLIVLPVFDAGLTPRTPPATAPNPSK